MAGSSYRVLPRRRFSKDTKRELVEEFLGNSVSLARFARDRDLHTNQLARWRREYLAGEYGAPGSQPQSQWVEVAVAEREAPQAAQALAVSQVRHAPLSLPNARDGEVHRLEIQLARGTVVLEGPCTERLLRSIVEALQ
jgi:transposase-like protein